MDKIKKKLKQALRKPTKEEMMHYTKNTLLVLLGTLILALGTELFIIPASLVTGGVAGIAVVLSFVGVPIETEVLITIISWSLFTLGVIFLGFRFSIKTLCSTLTYPVFLMLIKLLITYYPWMLIENAPSLQGETAIVALLSALFGGVFVGAGCAVTFLGGGSTGGVDIITFILCKFIKSIKSSVSIFVVDAIVVISGFVFNPQHDLALCILGVLSAFIASLVIDKIFQGTSKFFVAYVITDKYQELNEGVRNYLDRTTSIIDIEGGYSHESKKMVMISYSMREYNAIMALVGKIDKKAFMTIHRAHDINGEGFSLIKNKNGERND